MEANATSLISAADRTSLGSAKEINNLIKNAESHVLQGDKFKYAAKEKLYNYSGMHTKSGLERFAKENGTGQYILKNLRVNPETGVYEAVPVIPLRNGHLAVHSGNKGVVTFFPDNWSPGKIRYEVEYASQHIIGQCINRRNGYVGMASDGKTKIVIQYDEFIKKGTPVKKITSYYPLFE